jgi:hypothetical protein
MIEVDPRTRSSIWGLVAVLLGAGWAAYSISGGAGNPQVFLTVMVVLSILLAGGVAALVRKRTPGEPMKR